MKSTVLMDIERHAACDIQVTFEKWRGKIEWVSSPAFKFIMFEADELVIGPISDHSYLYAAHSLQSAPIDSTLKEKSKAFSRKAWEGKTRRVVAAGEVATDGQVTGWKSACFRLETPAHMRGKIQAEITALFQRGALTPP
jgi:hypothetical protein